MKNKNITIVGAGGRVLKEVLPVLERIKFINLNQIITAKSKKKINFEGIYSSKIITTNNLEEISLNDIDILYIAVPCNQIYSVLKRLITSEYIKDIHLLIDTPPLHPLLIFKLGLFRKFKSANVLEDYIYNDIFLLTRKLMIASIGKLKNINFQHSGFKYHAFAVVRKFFKIKGFYLIKKNVFTPIYSIIKIYKNFQISSIIEPRDYNIGRILFVGNNGIISNFLNLRSEVNNSFVIKNNIEGNTYKGFSFFNNETEILKKEIEPVELQKDLKYRNLEIYNINKSKAIENYFVDFIQKINDGSINNSALYSIEDAFYDNFASYFLDKFGLFFDIPLFFNGDTLIYKIIEIIKSKF